jgi:hypothetical protein
MSAVKNQDFWAGFRATITVGKFGEIHPFAPRQYAAEKLGLRGIADVFAWQKANRSRIVREINRALKPKRLRLLGTRGGYARAKPIA